MYTIAKDFNFCFGHRVWSQVLDANFADDLQCACRHLHGHEAKVVVHMTAPTLTRGMITDFRHLEWFKKFLDNNLDHKFVVDQHDPLFKDLTKGREIVEVWDTVGALVGWTLRKSEDDVGPQLEYLESFFVVDFVPTSENFSKWIYEIVKRKMSHLGVTVESIEWWESPKSRSVYTKN